MDNKVFKVSRRPLRIMTNEAKEASEERIEKLADKVIDENKRLLKRLEVEEKETIISGQSIAGVDPFLEAVDVITKQSLQDTANDDFQPVTTGEYRTSSPKRNKVELTTTV